SLPPGTLRIQAVYNGTPEMLGSVSRVLLQKVRAVSTRTFLTSSLTTRANGQRVLLLSAAVSTTGGPSGTPTGAVIFRRNGVPIGRAKLEGGVASLGFKRFAHTGGRFRAVFQGSSGFLRSQSAVLTVQV